LGQLGVRLIAAVADEEALRVLKLGSAAWNERRKLEKFGGAAPLYDLAVEPNLSRANLRNANLFEQSGPQRGRC
jgi:hypothetical protein